MKTESKDERRSRSLHRAGRGQAWSASKSEETIATLYLIAALVAFKCGYDIAGNVLMIKWGLGIIAACIEAIRSESGEPPTQR